MKLQSFNAARESNLQRTDLVVVDKDPAVIENLDQFDGSPTIPRSWIQSHSDAAMIKKCFGISPQLIRDLRGGDNRVYLVDNEWIFRIPRTESARQANCREQALLHVLSKQIKSTVIPRYEFWDATKGAGGYREIRGNNLSRMQLFRFTPDERIDLARNLATALSELHQTPCEQVRVQLSRGEVKQMERLHHFESLFEAMQPFSIPESEIIQEACARVRRIMMVDDGPLVVAHGDLHCDNILIDENKRCLAGLIDFSDAVIGPAVLDLVGMYRASPELAEDVQRFYAQAMRCDEDALRRDCRALAVVIFAREVLINRQEKSTQGVRRLSRAGYVLASIFESGI